MVAVEPRYNFHAWHQSVKASFDAHELIVKTYFTFVLHKQYFATFMYDNHKTTFASLFKFFNYLNKYNSDSCKYLFNYLIFFQQIVSVFPQGANKNGKK